MKKAIRVVAWCYFFCAAWTVFFLALFFSPRSSRLPDPTLFYMDKWFDRAIKLVPHKILKYCE